MGIFFSIEQDEQRFQERRHLSSHKSPGVGVGLGVLLLAIFIGWLCKVLRKQRIEKLKKKYFKCNGGLLLQEQLSSEDNVEKVKMFNSKELDKATDHYNVDRMLGQGGQGTVYKGILRNGKIVAVKKLKALDEGNIRQFINEVVILSQINHRNVVRLLGCCLETEVPLLVYEFIPNGNLFQLIHESNEEFTLTWNARLRIAKEVAGALSYLHSAASIPIYHRDVKSTNILLDDKYRAKVADFGTSKPVTIDQTHVTTLVKGTFGYFDPEYFRSSHFTDKSDVYSFGVVLSELLTGQKPIFSMSSGEVQDLAGYFVHAMEENRLFDIIDTQVIGEATNDEILSVAKLASRCLNWTGKKRPTMKEVTMVLEDIHGRSQQGLDFSHSSTKTCTPDSSSINSLSISPNTRSVTDFCESFGNGNVDIFTYKEMALATKRFQPHYVLGKGGFGVVYKGVINESVRRGYGTTYVAIKKFNPDGLQGNKEWQAEVNYLGQLRHPNLVKLVGYCREDKHRLLVYEYMASGSLDVHLFCRVGCTLTWSKRMKIALDAAKGLAFLHGAERSIIYRDFKTSNILLDESFNAKLSDFGFAKHGPMGDQTHVSTVVLGTYGYAAPEYIATGHLTTRSDIYGFGVVLLELLLGRRALDTSRPSQERNLVEWARPFLNQNKKVLKILDPRMEGQYSSETAIKVANLAYQCLSPNPRGRPLINQVVDLLETVQSNDKDGSIQNASEGKTLYEDGTHFPSCLFGKENTYNEKQFEARRRTGKKWTWKWKEQK